MLISGGLAEAILVDAVSHLHESTIELAPDGWNLELVVDVPTE